MAGLEDRIEIEDLFTRYSAAIDARDMEALDSVFTADAVIDYTTSGGIRGKLPEIKAWLAEALAPFTVLQHLNTNLQLEIAGDRATSRVSIFNPMGLPDGEGGVRLFFVGGYYDDKLVRTPDGWRIHERFEQQLWTYGSLPEGFEIPR